MVCLKIENMFGDGLPWGTLDPPEGWSCNIIDGKISKIMIVGQGSVPGCATLMLDGDSLDTIIHEASAKAISEYILSGNTTDEGIARFSLPNDSGFGLLLVHMIAQFKRLRRKR